ncbi:SusD/RagB family nutrient-binding outer membrane lipoprotein [Maribellus luteus]|uniref:SusD/RagB family nutrient-binding outer membrane lipoprotein n=1 Tax=Maribellus luteus TaxID=2305463 RepID=A0A399SP43_9BACT|nr:SusD/RagB family nutrient-binding outer membrane lipoprotein [Maribellus luteus]RIJ45460.1 SusD/RagB family nutrient-binding outer membrane lipoprotein [Maribellus luteus]
MKKYIIILLIAFFANACTDNFEEFNSNPYQISGESLKQDFNFVGAYFPTLLANIFGHQIEENLAAESFCDHMATPTPFVAGVNNTTYYIRWNTYWNRIYNSIMAPSEQVIKLAQEEDYPVFEAWAKLIRIMGMSRLTTYHGPVIYSDYGSSAATVNYDSEQNLYNTFFTQLDEIQAVFSANADYNGMKNFDATYKGDVTQWMKLVNSLRLRLAIRISKVAPTVAKTQGEKAIADPAGLILTNADNTTISLYGGKLYLSIICFEWDDTRMSAGMESILIGLKDNRISKMFAPATDNTLYPDHPEWPYKGIRNGALLADKSQRTSFSKINESFKSITKRNYLAASEVYFDLAEAGLRGWTGAGNPQENYETGVRLSFADWGAGGVDAYLADETSKPLNYTDPVSSPVNDYVARSTITVKWNNADSNELKLEKIITQKWIAGFFNPNEPWADFRRTGYPKLNPVYKNDSSPDWGVIPAGDFIKRMPFVNAERTGNPQGVAAAVATMGSGAKDDIATSLWWDVDGPNF